MGRRRKTSGEAFVDSRFPQGPSDSQDRLSIPPQTSSSNTKGKGLQPRGARHANAVSGVACSNLTTDSFSGPNSDGRPSIKPEEDKGPLANTDASGKLSPPAERKETEASNMDVTWEQNNLEAHLQAGTFRETLKLSEAFNNAFQQREKYFQLQKSLLSRSEEIVAATLDEFTGVITKLRTSNIAQEVLEQDIAKAIIGQLHLDKHRLHEDLRKCHSQLQSAEQDMNLKTCEIEQLKQNVLMLHEVKGNLEQKVEKIQQQLCQDRAGHHGSYLDGLQTPFLVESTAKDVFNSIAAFSNKLSKYTDSNGSCPAEFLVHSSDLWKGLHLSRPNHWKFVLKAHICNYLFQNFQSETFIGSGNTLMFLEHEERVSMCYEYFTDCKTKGVWEKAILHSNNDNFGYFFFEYLADKCFLLPLDSLRSGLYKLFKSHDEHIGAHLHDILSRLDVHKRQLVETLIFAAGNVWQFHKLCLSFEPPVTIFRVSNGDSFNQDYMDSIDAPENDDHSSNVPKVSFMILSWIPP